MTKIVTIGDCVTLYHGDALQIMQDITDVDLCVTDPPYELTRGGNTPGGVQERIGSGYDNSGKMFDDIPHWSEFMPLIHDCLSENAHFYSMADAKNQFEMQHQAKNAGFKFHNLLYWDKKTCTPNRWYMKNCEYTGLFYKGKAFPINNCSSKQGVYVHHTDVTDHPTEKPVLLMRHYIENSSQVGQTVMDPFMGTGTTGVAAMQSGRKFIGIEKDDQYFDIAVERVKRAYAEKKQLVLF